MTRRIGTGRPGLTGTATIVALALVAGTTVAVVVWRGSAGPRPVRAVAETPAPNSSPTSLPIDPAPATRAVPTGFRHDASGAVAAAAAYVTSGQRLLDVDPFSAEEAIRRMAATTTADEQVRTARDRLRSVRQSLAAGTGPITYWQAPIAWKLEAIESSRARVSVWHVGILSRQGVAPPQAAWSVSALELVWEHGDWKVLAQAATPGPAPILDNSAMPATGEQLAVALDGFSAFGPRP